MAVIDPASGQHNRAIELAQKLSLPLVEHENGHYDFVLLYTGQGLALKQTGEKGLGPITVSFTNPAMTYRLKHGGGRRQALARAVGLKKGWQPTVIDATAGLGRDSFILAALGCQVLMLERSPILAALLEDALQRAAQEKQIAPIIKDRLQLIRADSRIFLQDLKQRDRPDVIYLDPMYPERTKSSLVKKEMRILRGLAGDDQDATALLAIGLERAQNRVVVKRPRLADTLSGIKPNHQITGKTSRFDVYLI